jgi:hypothetical protein
MAVPETAVNKNGLSPAAEDDIGRSGQLPRMKSESKAHPMQERSNENLGFRVAASYRSHVGGAMLRAEPIHTLLKPLTGV